MAKKRRGPQSDEDFIKSLGTVDDEVPKLARAQLVKIADFWRAAGVRWQRWAERLLPQPWDGLWGDDSNRKLIGRELRRLRRAAPQITSIERRLRDRSWQAVKRSVAKARTP